MSDDIEDLVAEFVERRETDPGLQPEAFAAEHPAHPALAAALQRALGVLDLLPAANQTPATIGPYTVRREIGRGATSLVYEVECDGARRALKLLAAAPILGDRCLERFRREAETLAKLRHDGIVSVLDSGLHRGIPYLVLELVEGPTLAERSGDLDRAAAISVVRRVAEALAVAHAQGIQHRDLKPQNIVLRPDGSPVVVDFGLVALPGQATLTGTGDLLGTPLYMAPEQALGHETDVRADVHALGLILYELLAGHPARRLPEDAANAGALRLATVAARSRIPPIRSVQPDVPEALDRILRVALAERPAWRYGSAGPLAEDLARFERGAPPLARPPGPLARAAYGLARRPVAAVSLLGVLCSSALLLLWSPWQGHVPMPPEPTSTELAERSLAARDYDGAIQHYEAAVRAEPSAATWLGLARAAYFGARWERGLQAVERSLALAGAQPPPGTLSLQGALLDELGRHDEAQAVFRALGARYPESTTYAFNLAHSLDRSNRVRDAHATYVALLERDPGHARALACLAWLVATARDEFADLRDPARAEELSLRLLEADQGRSEPLLRTVADVATKTGRLDRVVPAMEAIAARPGLPPAAAARLRAQARSLRHSAEGAGK